MQDFMELYEGINNRRYASLTTQFYLLFT